MRIAAWMLTPEDKKLRDDSTATLAAGAVYTCESLLRQVGPATLETVVRKQLVGAEGSV